MQGIRLWVAARRDVTRWMAVLLLLFLGIFGAAEAEEIEPGALGKVTLGPDEGVVVLVVANSSAATSVRVVGDGLANKFLVGKLVDGRNVRVFRVHAGDYRWDLLQFNGGRAYVDLPHEYRYAFSVAPGVLNYPGDLDLSADGARVSMQHLDRAATTMINVDKLYPGLRQQLAWRTEADSPDPFAGFLQEHFGNVSLQASAEAAEAQARKTTRTVVDPAVQALTEELFAPDRIGEAHLNPTGDLLAYSESDGDEHKVMICDLGTGETLQAFQGKRNVGQLVWGGPRLLFIGLDRLRLTRSMPVSMLGQATTPGTLRIRIAATDPATSDVTRDFFEDDGWLVDGLPADPRYAVYARADGDGKNHLYRIDKTLKSFDLAQFQSQLRLDKGLNEARGVLTDRHGEPRAALSAEGGHLVLMSRDARGHWARVRDFGADDRVHLVTLSADGRSVVALTNAGRPQVELVRIALDSGATETLYGVPGSDLSAPRTRPRDGGLLSVSFDQGGAPQRHYFEPADDARLATLAAKFPKAGVVLWEDSEDGRRILLFVHSETDPGSFHFYDAANGRLDKRLDLRPEFKHGRLSASEVFQAQAADGLNIDTFVTLPFSPQGDKVRFPLVVVPHGGPIGVRDRLGFDPQVQFLVNRGYAVLRANYRGSSGAGRSFEDAGLAKWGRQIEDDIEAAVDAAIKRYPLDPDRVALLGASYGGYSTLMGLIRAPQRYRCGVAISAVTDLPVLFNGADWAQSPALAARMKHVVGDPQTAMDELLAVSPVYQFHKLTRPVLLIHGTADRRVPYEHALRLRSLLALDGRMPEWLPIVGGGHALSDPSLQAAIYAAGERFLASCLAAPPTPGKAAESGL